jgi:hypothetical protein
VKGWIVLSVVILAALVLAIVATLIGSRVSNPAVASCANRSYCLTNIVEYESYGWPIPWRIDEGAADDAEIGTAGISISSFIFSVALWFWVALAPVLLVAATLDRQWTQSLAAIVLAGVLITLGVASSVTVLGARNSSSGVHSSGDTRLRYESAGWPIEWKTNPWLWSGLDSPPSPYGGPERDSYHAALRPYNALGYSPTWLALNYVLVAIPTLFAQGILIAVASWAWPSIQRLTEGPRGRSPTTGQS